MPGWLGAAAGADSISKQPQSCAVTQLDPQTTTGTITWRLKKKKKKKIFVGPKSGKMFFFNARDDKLLADHI